MKKYLYFFLFFLFFTFSTTLLYSSNIVYPWRATSTIVQKGKSFEIWLNADTIQQVEKVVLKAQYNDVVPTYKISYGNWVYDVTSQNRFNQKIVVAIPQSAPADRYDLILKTTKGDLISNAAVKVISEIKSTYYLLHISDIHAFQNGYETTLQRLTTIVDIANIINPEIVFNTGDNLYRPTEERMSLLFDGDLKLGAKGLNQFNAATFTIVGNHDVDMDQHSQVEGFSHHAKFWNRWWGLQSFQFEYGNGRYLGINNGWPGFDATHQIEESTSFLKRVGSGNFRVLAAHIRGQQMNKLDSAAMLNLVLIGHNHHIANTNPSLLNNMPKQYIANSVRDNMEFNLFKVEEKSGRFTPVSSPSAQVVYIENPEDAKSPVLYRPKLTLHFEQPNDGSFFINKATLINKFDFPIDQAKIRFIVPKGKKYSISLGKIEQEFDGRMYHIIDVLVNVAARSSCIVSLSGK